jgi:hypothetical protein
MKFSRQFLVVFIFCRCVLLGAAALAAEQPALVPASPTTISPPSVLPTEFSGWQGKGVVAKSADPAAADAANAPVLKEYGFQRL